MELVEIRVLDGPNLFGFEPLVKVELSGVGEEFGVDVVAVSEAIRQIHLDLELPEPVVGQRQLDLPGHVALTFPWQYETLARGIALCAVESVNDPQMSVPLDRLHGARERDIQEGNFSGWIRDSERQLPAVGITATNGKTTTTRMLAHIARQAGKRAGWSSSSGVYIEGELVLEGDYTGPGGARRVLREPGIDLAILETARGGMLLRGLAYESNDVGIFINVAADHLSLQGVETLETLAEVKSLVVRVTKSTGTAVLNADQPLVWCWRDQIEANVIAISQRPSCAEVTDHLLAGGQAIVSDGKSILLLTGSDDVEAIVSIGEIPATFGGAARFMVENALAATAGAYALGLSLDEIASGLKTFHSDSATNPGRMNVFRVNDATVVLDFAHNPDGLRGLISFCQALKADFGSMRLILGTAGDRRDEDHLEIGRIAGESGNALYLKNTPGYERGRSAAEIVGLMRQGVEEVDAGDRISGEYPSERDAVDAALNDLQSGDVLAVMCLAEHEAVRELLSASGSIEV